MSPQLQIHCRSGPGHCKGIRGKFFEKEKLLADCGEPLEVHVGGYGQAHACPRTLQVQLLGGADFDKLPKDQQQCFSSVASCIWKGPAPLKVREEAVATVTVEVEEDGKASLDGLVFTTSSRSHQHKQKTFRLFVWGQLADQPEHLVFVVSAPFEVQTGRAKRLQKPRAPSGEDLVGVLKHVGPGKAVLLNELGTHLSQGCALPPHLRSVTQVKQLLEVLDWLEARNQTNELRLALGNMGVANFAELCDHARQAQAPRQAPAASAGGPPLVPRELGAAAVPAGQVAAFPPVPHVAGLCPTQAALGNLGPQHQQQLQQPALAALPEFGHAGQAGVHMQRAAVGAPPLVPMELGAAAGPAGQAAALPYVPHLASLHPWQAALAGLEPQLQLQLLQALAAAHQLHTALLGCGQVWQAGVHMQSAAARAPALVAQQQGAAAGPAGHVAMAGAPAVVGRDLSSAGPSGQATASPPVGPYSEQGDWGPQLLLPRGPACAQINPQQQQQQQQPAYLHLPAPGPGGATAGVAAHGAGPAGEGAAARAGDGDGGGGGAASVVMGEPDAEEAGAAGPSVPPLGPHGSGGATAGRPDFGSELRPNGSAARRCQRPAPPGSGTHGPAQPQGPLGGVGPAASRPVQPDMDNPPSAFTTGTFGLTWDDLVAVSERPTAEHPRGVGGHGVQPPDVADGELSKSLSNLSLHRTGAGAARVAGPAAEGARAGGGVRSVTMADAGDTAGDANAPPQVQPAPAAQAAHVSGLGDSQFQGMLVSLLGRNGPPQQNEMPPNNVAHAFHAAADQGASTMSQDFFKAEVRGLLGMPQSDLGTERLLQETFAPAPADAPMASPSDPDAELLAAFDPWVEEARMAQQGAALGPAE